MSSTTERFSRRLPKIFALGTPFIALTAYACDSGSSQSPPQTPEPYQPTMGGEPKGAATNPTIAPTVEMQASTPTIEEFPEPASQETILVNYDGNTYELYRGITIAKIKETASRLESADKDKFVRILAGVDDNITDENPNGTAITVTLNSIINMADAICEQDKAGFQELTLEIASWIHENQPEQYEGTRKLAEQGPCSVLGENQVVAPTPESRQNTRSTIPIYSENYEYELYAYVTLDDIIAAANKLPQSNTKPKILENLSIFKTTQNNQPGTDILISLIDEVVALNDANCQGDLPPEFAMLVASYLNRKFPAQFGRSTIFEKGPCTPIRQARSPIARKNHDVVPTTGLGGEPIFWTDKYVYTLYDETIQSPGDRFSDPVALSIAFGPVIPAFEQVFLKAQKIDEIRRRNTYDPAQLPIFEEILTLTTKEVCDASKVGGTNAYTKSIASVEYYLDPPNWPGKADKYTTHPCFWGETF